MKDVWTEVGLPDIEYRDRSELESTGLEAYNERRIGGIGTPVCIGLHTGRSYDFDGTDDHVSTETFL